MNTRSFASSGPRAQLAVMLAILPMIGFAQVPVDESGNPIGEYQAQASVPGSDAFNNDEFDGDGFTTASPAELEDLVGSIALYPDDLLAIILPASTYPLQLVEASRFLEELQSDPSLQPDDDWDDSVVALTNYPEVIQLLNDDLDWTWQLGEAVVAQQADIIAAIESFRDRAYAAGNLKSDEYQEVTQDEGVIEITPVNEDIIYVPYYEPESVVVYQPQPVYRYYPRAYPVYYYPYPYGHSFRSGYFWGVTTAFTIGWATDYLHVHHHSYHGHPYYGYSYNSNWWYRRPSINVHNTYYVNNYNSRTNNYYQNGDRWQSNNTRRMGAEQRVTQSRYRPSSGSQVVHNRTTTNFASSSRESASTIGRSSNSRSSNSRSSNSRSSAPRSSASNLATSAGRNTTRQESVNRTSSSNSTSEIRFRKREENSGASHDRQSGASTRSRGRDTSVTATPGRQSGSSSRSGTNTATARTQSASDIQFERRNNGQRTRANSGNSSDTSRSSTTSRRPIVASNNATTSPSRAASSLRRQTNNTSKTTTVPRTTSSSPSRSATSRPSVSQSSNSQAKSARRVEQSSASRQPSRQQSSQTQRQSQSSGTKSSSGSGSNKSESSSRSSSRSSSSKKSRSRDT